jgi:RND family efflux transporter MFP subunit
MSKVGWIAGGAIVGIGVAALIYFVAANHSNDQAAASPTSNPSAPPAVDVTKVVRQTLFHRVDLPATLEAFDQAELYAKVAGYVSEVKADIGDHPKAGRVLAVISVPELKAELAEAQARLGVSKATLALRQVTFKRQQQLLAEKAITPQQFDETQGQLDVARAEVDLAAATVEKLEAMLRYTNIVAPFDGVVTQRVISPGQLVQAGVGNRTTPLFTMQRIDTIRVFCDVPESEAMRVRVKDDAKVSLYGMPDQLLIGSVTRIAVGMDPQTRTMRTEIDLPNTDEKLHPGTYAQVTLEVNRRPDALTVPLSAIGADGSVTFVAVIDHDRIARVPVKVGMREGDRAEITEGVIEGADVVVTAKAAPPGTEVRPNQVQR